MNFLKKHRETLTAAGFGLIIFLAFNLLLVYCAPEKWTTPRLGPWSAFHSTFVFSGFDGVTYLVLSDWKYLFDTFRHPLMSWAMWPSAWLCHQLKDIYHINCAIYVVAAMYVIFNTLSWVMMYKILRKRIGLKEWMSHLLCFFYWGLAYVMLTAFVPDHMMWTQLLLLTTVYLASGEKGLSLLQGVLLFFVSGGVSLTNVAKIWFCDMLGKKRDFLAIFKRSLIYVIPMLLLIGAYAWQENVLKPERDNAFKAAQAARHKNLSEAQLEKRRQDSIASVKRESERQSKQMVNNRYFQYTDNTIDRLPLLYENVFGEGLILHEDYALMDANSVQFPRPIFVKYHHTWTYAIEGLIVLLFIIGTWYGRRERLLWMAAAMFFFDMTLHVGLRFAASDVYIMTAHWAMIIPFSIAYLLREIETKTIKGIEKPSTVFGIILILLTIYLWIHNAGIISNHLLNVL